MASAALAFGWMAAIIAVKGLRIDWDDLSVEALDGLLGVRAIDEFDEGESPRTSGLPIDRQHDLRRRRHGAEVTAQIRFSGAVGEITDEQTDGQSTVS